MSHYNEQDLIEMVQRIMDCEEDDETMEHLLDELDNNVPHPAISDLIYWPDDDEDCSAEKIIKIALSYNWKENIKIFYSKSMKQLIDSATTEDINRNSQEDLFSNFEICATPVNIVETTKDVNNIVKKNTIDLNTISSSTDFEDLLVLVNKLEYCLKEIYPNKIFCSYFIYKKVGHSVFKFHVDYPSIDWIDNDDVYSSLKCIRKKIF